MTTYQLIKLEPLELQFKSLNGFPSSIIRSTSAPTAPGGYKYVENLPMPEEAAPEGQYYVRELTVDSYGWKLDPIPEIVIEAVTNIQMRDALIDEGLHDQVDTIIANMPETTPEEIIEKKKMYDWWHHALNIRRDNPRVATMQVALGLTDEEVDAIFLAASLVD